jgi:hypothetical protein|tara:strand:+ start:734 stop:937 length:204 start_codon:yes stop_codon:yes gene_type:complete
MKPISKNNVVLQKGDKCIFVPEKKTYLLEPNKKVIVRNVYDNGVVEVHHNTGIYTNVYANQLIKERA